ncbi:MAG TPA: glycogen synthase GlgA [Candidatus Acidoferrales bacterium]|jgi:starch synthase|nr:glycogen synthase GlgA [Candidatus Acidoferrales bacterium]
MNILLATGEVHPYSKTGGLADMVGALAKTLARTGHDARVVTPLYRGIQEQFPQIRREDWWFDLPLGGRRVQAELLSLPVEQNLTVYFIRQPDFYDRKGLYLEDDTPYTDNAERFIFFSKCVVHLARYLPWRPDVIHIHDWQTGVVPALILNEQRHEGWGKPPPTCLTIHNLAYQGIFPRTAFGLTNLPPAFFTMETAEYFGHLNCLKAGIALADSMTTVSPRYAREILTEEYGCGLDGLLRKRQARLTGILNGVDYEEWNTMTDRYLVSPYSAARLGGKKIDKTELQKEMGLAVTTGPLFGTITRLAEQKGIDIQLAALEEMLSSNMQFVLLGAGSPAYEHGYHELARRFPNKVATRFGYNEGLSHRIEAGCDFYLMPSRYEPSGLNQMYSLRYGTIPVVRATGGLDDSVVDFTENKAQANGIKFSEYSPRALSRAIRKALALYEQPELLSRYRKNAMKCDFSWERTVRQYLKVYESAKTPAG